MGLFGLFKKNFQNKKTSVPQSNIDITTTEAKTPPQPYTPWSGKPNPNTPFANVNFLNWANGKTVPKSNDEYPRKMSYHYGISQPLKKHTQMISGGFLEEGKTTDSLKRLKVDELKEILSQHTLPVTGKKDILIQRIVENIPSSKLDIDPVYILSPKGREYVEKYAYYTNLDSHLTNGDISISEFDTLKKEHPYSSNNDIIWQNLNQKDLTYFRNQDYGLLRNNELSRYRILKEENRMQDATYHLLVVFYYDLSGMNNDGIISNYDDLLIAPGLIPLLREVKNFVTPDVIHKIYQKVYVPFHYFDIDIFTEIIYKLLNNDVDLKNYRHKANNHCDGIRW